MALALLVSSSFRLAEVGTGGCFSWLWYESCVGLCCEVRRRPLGGGLPSASLRCLFSPNRGEASVDLVTFEVCNSGCTMMWMGPTPAGR